MTTGPRLGVDRTTLGAFLVMTLVSGANAVAVRYTVAELPPFWGAVLRFAAAGASLVVVMAATGRSFPRGQRLVGTVVYGVLNFGVPYALLYWGIQEAPAGTAQVLLAVVPLLTIFLAVAHGVERFRPLGLVGALVAAAGIALIFRDQVSLDVAPLALVAILGGAVAFAEAGVLVKRIPPGDPIAANAVGMLLGGAALLVFSLVAGERQALPVLLETWLAIAYLVVFGSVVTFVLALYVLERWTASAVSYTFLLIPLVTIVLGALLLHEPVQPVFLLGGALVLTGVYIGAFYSARRRPAVAAP